MCLGKFTGENGKYGLENGKDYPISLSSSDNNLIVTVNNNIMCYYSSSVTMTEEWHVIDR